MDLEKITLDGNPSLSHSVKNLQEIQTNPLYVEDNLTRHVFENNAFKKLSGKIKDKDAREELEKLVMKYSKGMVLDSNGFKKAHRQYHVGKVGKMLGTGAIASGLMYALPGRFYPSVNGIGGALQYLNPFSGKNMVKDLAKYTVLKGIKGIGSTLFSPFMYLSAGYTLYKVIKGLIQRKKLKNQKSKLIKNLSDEDLYQTLEELKQIKGIKEDYSHLRPEVKYEEAA